MSTRLHTRLLAFCCVFALALAACAEPAEPEPVVEDPVTEDEMEVAPADVDVEGTIDAVQGGLTTLAPSAALANINGWIETLRSPEYADNEEIQEVATILEELRAELSEPTLDTDDIGQLLEELGTNTVEVGTAAGNASVTRLGELLGQAGEQLDDL